MSYRGQKKNSKYKPHLSNEISKYCPNYNKYDKRARDESKDRINQHLRERRGGVKNCVNRAVKELKELGISINKDAPKFIDDDEIINNAAKQTTIQINKWDGVQIKQCKKADKNGEIILIDTFQKFVKKAKNHQDQTSWKISGDHFFAPYIKKARQFLCEYCSFIMDISSDLRRAIKDLVCLSFANALFHEEIKFHRTKPKPLMRHRTLVKSQGIHIKLQELHKILTVRRFIQCAKAERKSRVQKSNIIAGDFFMKLKRFTNQQYLQQKRKVYTLLHIQFEENDLILSSDIHFGDFEELKNIDIDDDDHSNEDDDYIDMISDSSSSSSSNTPPSVGINRSFKTKKRRFQATNTQTQLRWRETKENYKKMQRENRIKKKANSARKYCKTHYKSMNNDEFDMESIGDVSAINALISEEYNYNYNNNNNNQFCSDCTNTNTIHADDRTTISTISTNTMSPMSLPTTTLDQYGNGNGGMVTPILKLKAADMQRENDELRREIQYLTFILSQRVLHYHAPPPPPPPPLHPYPHHLYYERPHGRPYQTHVPPPLPIQAPMQPPLPPLPPPPQQAPMQPPLPPFPATPPTEMIDIDIDIDNEEDEKLLFPDGTMINDDSLSCQLSNNQSRRPFIHELLQSVDPLPSYTGNHYNDYNQFICMPGQYNQSVFMPPGMSPSPKPRYNLDSAFN